MRKRKPVHMRRAHVHTWMRTVAAVTISCRQQGRLREGLVPVSRRHLQIVDGVRPLERIQLCQGLASEEPEGRDGVEQAHRPDGSDGLGFGGASHMICIDHLDRESDMYVLWRSDSVRVKSKSIQLKTPLSILEIVKNKLGKTLTTVQVTNTEKIHFSLRRDSDRSFRLTARDAATCILKPIHCRCRLDGIDRSVSRRATEKRVSRYVASRNCSGAGWLAPGANFFVQMV